MTDLYPRVLLWHKLVAMVTGGLALCSARHRLNRDEARGWSNNLRNVADEIDQVLLDGTFILDNRGQRMVGCEVVVEADGAGMAHKLLVNRITRQVIEAAAKRVESLNGGTSYKQAWLTAARSIRAMKPD